MILVDCSTVGSLSFFQVNVSGGEPCEVQLNVRGEPTAIVTVDDDGLSITGAAVYKCRIVTIK